MRFILVECPDGKLNYGISQWRATHVKEDGHPIDVFFYADDITKARAHVRARYPHAKFSDQEPFDAL